MVLKNQMLHSSYYSSLFDYFYSYFRLGKFCVCISKFNLFYTSQNKYYDYIVLRLIIRILLETLISICARLGENLFLKIYEKNPHKSKWNTKILFHMSETRNKLLDSIILIIITLHLIFSHFMFHYECCEIYLLNNQ